MNRSSNQFAAPDWVLRLGLLLCAVGLGLAAYLGFTAPADNLGGVPVTPVSTATHKLVTKPIEQVRLGERIVGFNPLREQVDASEPDPATWRKISLFLTKGSGNGLWVDLLRPLEWVEEQQAQPGATIFIDLYEMGAVGDATVLAIAPCPPIEPGSGTVVTGTFKHQADANSQVIRLQLAGQSELTCVTANHPYWSKDRQDFVAASQLLPGEHVDTALGLTQVVSLTPAQHTGYLYNLETTEHVYRIGEIGTLVHNSCYDDFADLPIRNKVGAGAARPPRHHVFPQEKRQWFKDRGVDIDKVTIPLDQGTHSALHTMKWSERVMGDLIRQESILGRQLTPKEIWRIGYRHMRKAGIDKLPILPYKD